MGRRNTMQDIAVATGAQFVSEDIGLTLDDAELDVLGTAEKVIISKDDTIIMGGAGERADIGERVSQIGSAIEATTSEYDREKLQEYSVDSQAVSRSSRLEVPQR